MLLPPSVTATLRRIPASPAAAGDSEGLLNTWLLRVTIGDELTAGRQRSEGLDAVGEAVEALKMLVRTATSFSASTLQECVVT